MPAKGKRPKLARCSQFGVVLDFPDEKNFQIYSFDQVDELRGKDLSAAEKGQTVTVHHTVQGVVTAFAGIILEISDSYKDLVDDYKSKPQTESSNKTANAKTVLKDLKKGTNARQEKKGFNAKRRQLNAMTAEETRANQDAQAQRVLKKFKLDDNQLSPATPTELELQEGKEWEEKYKKLKEKTKAKKALLSSKDDEISNLQAKLDCSNQERKELKKQLKDSRALAATYKTVWAELNSNFSSLGSDLKLQVGRLELEISSFVRSKKDFTEMEIPIVHENITSVHLVENVAIGGPIVSASNNFCTQPDVTMTAPDNYQPSAFNAPCADSILETQSNSDAETYFDENQDSNTQIFPHATTSQGISHSHAVLEVPATQGDETAASSNSLSISESLSSSEPIAASTPKRAKKTHSRSSSLKCPENMFNLLDNNKGAQLKNVTKSSLEANNLIPFPLKHDIYISAADRLVSFRESLTATAYTKALCKSIMSKEALLWCSFEGRKSGGRFNSGALPAIHSHIKDAIWADVLAQAEVVQARRALFEKAKNLNTEPPSPLLDSKGNKISEKSFEKWSSLTWKNVKNETAKIFSTNRIIHERQLEAVVKAKVLAAEAHALEEANAHGKISMVVNCASTQPLGAPGAKYLAQNCSLRLSKSQ